MSLEIIDSISLFTAFFQNTESVQDIASANLGSSSTKYVTKSGPKEMDVLGVLLTRRSVSSSSGRSSLIQGDALEKASFFYLKGNLVPKNPASLDSKMLFLSIKRFLDSTTKNLYASLFFA